VKSGCSESDTEPRERESLGEGVSQVLFTCSIARSLGGSSHRASTPVTHPPVAVSIIIKADVLGAADAPTTETRVSRLECAGVRLRVPCRWAANNSRVFSRV